MAPAPGCTSVDRWEYGLDSGVPRYVLRPLNPTELRTNYLAKDITYLLGTADNDPNHHQLDRSCAAEAQGPTRLQRGIAYTKEMEVAGAQHQTVLKVPGVGHYSPQMFGSACGIFALFGSGACVAPPNAPKGQP